MSWPLWGDVVDGGMASIRYRQVAPSGFFAHVASIMTPPVAKSCTAKMEIAVRKLIIPKNEVLAAALFIVLQVRIR